MAQIGQNLTEDYVECKCCGDEIAPYAECTVEGDTPHECWRCADLCGCDRYEDMRTHYAEEYCEPATAGRGDREDFHADS